MPQAWCNRCCMELNTKHKRIIRDVLVLKTLCLLVAHGHEKFGRLRPKVTSSFETRSAYPTILEPRRPVWLAATIAWF